MLTRSPYRGRHETGAVADFLLDLATFFLVILAVTVLDLYRHRSSACDGMTDAHDYNDVDVDNDDDDE